MLQGQALRAGTSLHGPRSLPWILTRSGLLNANSEKAGGMTGAMICKAKA